MSTQQASLSQLRTNLALATLFLGMFVMGSAELLVVGVLNLIAADLEVSIPAAGVLVTAYAPGIAIGGPILTMLTIKLSRRTILIGALVLFILANLAPVVTDNYGLFVVARALAGALMGLFIAAAFTVGVAVVPPERMGRAIAVVISGVSVSAASTVKHGRFRLPTDRQRAPTAALTQPTPQASKQNCGTWRGSDSGFPASNFSFSQMICWTFSFGGSF